VLPTVCKSLSVAVVVVLAARAAAENSAVNTHSPVALKNIIASPSRAHETA
jgi:hypothetical protein